MEQQNHSFDCSNQQHSVVIPGRLRVQVRAHAVDVLRRTDDEELRYYLLQLVQALRYEAVDDSRLATFIVQRATRNPVLGILLHWYARSVCIAPSAVTVHPRHPVLGALFATLMLTAQAG